MAEQGKPEGGAMAAMAQQRKGESAEASEQGNAEDGLLRLASDIEAHGQREAALPIYQRAVSLSGGTPDSYVRLGDACLRAGRFKDASEAYRASLAKAPDNAEALLGVGSVMVRQGRPEAALETLSKAAPLLNTAVAYDRLGVAQTLAGQLPQARASFGTAVQLAPDDLDIRTNQALAAALADDGEAALTTMREIAHSPVAEARHRRDFVVVLGMTGHPAEAESDTALGDLSKKEVRGLLARASSIRSLSDPKARAKALGAIAG
ncbi:MAG: tetratricopeptide repeat protein [Bradyrhizobium sp.]|uniref:tetratricopeptide repeat protein n=1 Tax=Bradyrhizobium sp. TaxID=376 RepID=UPI001D80CEDC|nr:tetratricopeptide repeat protein [Bradyrhizobium sp.]MBV9564307.1 tetratricopeptide repeat protein [Bradyrhizobium sp.]